MKHFGHGHQKGQSEIISFAMLVTLGAVIGVSFYYIYSSIAPGTKAQLDTRKDVEIRRLESSISLYVPEVVREGDPCYAIVYNSGSTHITDVSAYAIRSNDHVVLSVTDENGVLLNVLLVGQLGYVRMEKPGEYAGPPRQGDVLVVGGKETFNFKNFERNVMQAKTVKSNTNVLDEVDGVYRDIGEGERECYDFLVGFPAAVYETVYLDSYLWSDYNLSFFDVEDYDGAIKISDSLSVLPSHAVYDLTSHKGDFWLADDSTARICFEKTSGNGNVRLDYLKLVVMKT